VAEPLFPFSSANWAREGKGKIEHRERDGEHYQYEKKGIEKKMAGKVMSFIYKLRHSSLLLVWWIKLCDVQHLVPLLW
jgi:hypothetical protein